MASFNIEKLLEEHEGENLEFRSELKAPEGDDKNRDVKTLSAFLNTTGGTIVYGVKEEASKRVVVGIGSPQTLESNLFNKIRAKLDPSEVPSINFASHDGKTLVIASIDRGNMPPYYAEGTAYKRVGSNNFPLEKSDITELLRNATVGDRKAVPAASLDDLDLELAKEVLSKRDLTKVIENDITDLLFKMGLLVESNGIRKPSIAGLLLFGKRPQDFLPNARIKAEMKLNVTSTEWDDILDCTGNLFEQIRQAESFAKRNIKISAKIVGFQRVEKPELPFEAVREAIINAVCHRDYSDEGTEVHFRIHGGLVMVESPGKLIPPITLNSILSNKFIPKTRNPIIADVLVSLNLMDKRGTGFLRMIDSMKKTGLAAPDFEELANGFRATFNPNNKIYEDDNVAPIHSDFLEKLMLDVNQKKILEAIQKRREISTSDAMAAVKKSRPTVLKVLKEMEDAGIIISSGKSKFDPNRKFLINTKILEREFSTKDSKGVVGGKEELQGSLFLN